MNTEQLKGKWEQLRGMVREQWGKLTDDDIDIIEGKRDQLIGRIRARYGYEKNRAEKEVDVFLERCDACDDDVRPHH